MTIRDVNRATDWNLPDDEANTVAGLVIHEAQMISLLVRCLASTAFGLKCWQKRKTGFPN
jgi:Mg2+/Co2+ transporter CorB